MFSVLNKTLNLLIVILSLFTVNDKNIATSFNDVQVVFVFNFKYIQHNVQCIILVFYY